MVRRFVRYGEGSGIGNGDYIGNVVDHVYMWSGIGLIMSLFVLYKGLKIVILIQILIMIMIL